MFKVKRRGKRMKAITGICIAAGLFISYTALLLYPSSDVQMAMEQISGSSSPIITAKQIMDSGLISEDSAQEENSIEAPSEPESWPVSEAEPAEEAIPSEEPAVIEKADDDFYIQELPLSYELQAYAYEVCETHDIQYEYFLALMWKESRFDVECINVNTNGTTDTGLMQINDVHKDFLAESLNITDLYDPRQNIQAGAYFISNLLNKYDEHDALYAYQYGESGMKSKIRQGNTTTPIIQKTLSKRDEFVGLRQQ